MSITKLFIDDIRNPVNHLSPEQAEGIVWVKTWWEARNTLFKNSQTLEVIHFDNYMDEPELTGKDLLVTVLGDCIWGDKSEEWPNLKQIYLHSSDKEFIDEMMELWEKDAKFVGIELIENSLENYE